jgi:hypothetical protein
MASMVNCSRCGSLDELHLVTIPYEENSGPGRGLVYCRACRIEMADLIDVDIPIEMVSHAVFLDLYRKGSMSSDPLTTVEMVFGKVDPDLVKQAQSLLP